MKAFWANPDIDMTTVKDSMQLNSGTVIAELSMDGYIASLEVRGEVDVYSEELEKHFYAPSEFPDDLKKQIKENPNWYLGKKYCINMNNWFEVFIGTTNDYLGAVVVDADGLSNDEIEELLKECISYYAD